MQLDARIVRAFSATAMLCMALAATCLAVFAQDQPAGSARPDARIVVIVHIDVFPPGTAETRKALQAFAQHARSDKGCLEFRVLQQIGRPNHFTLVEQWANQAAYDADLNSGEAKEFRKRLQPFLGSPFDERLHAEIK
jgi:quinol monooxygenase YgiN